MENLIISKLSEGHNLPQALVLTLSTRWGIQLQSEVVLTLDKSTCQVKAEYQYMGRNGEVLTGQYKKLKPNPRVAKMLVGQLAYAIAEQIKQWKQDPEFGKEYMTSLESKGLI